MRNQRRYIDIPVPSDPAVPLVAEQLVAMFPSLTAGQAFFKLIGRVTDARLASPHPHPKPTMPAVPSGEMHPG